MAQKKRENRNRENRNNKNRDKQAKARQGRAEHKTAPLVKAREVSAEEFYKHFIENRTRIGKYQSWKTDLYSLKDYKQMEAEGAKFYLTENNSTLAVKANGEMISLVRGKNKKENLHGFVAYAEKQDGRFFTCYGSYERFFKECGCIRIKTDPWKEELAPSDWKPEYKTEPVISFITKEESVRVIELLKDRFKLKRHLSKKDIAELYPLVYKYEQLHEAFSADAPEMKDVLADAGEVVNAQKDVSKAVREINTRGHGPQNKGVGIGIGD